MIELACPESCQYLQAARPQAAEREHLLRIKELEASGKLDLDVNEKILVTLYVIDEAIVKAYRESFREMKDADIEAALENVIRNLETESSGLIYEHNTPSLRVQELSRAIREALDELAGKAPAEDPLRRSDKIKALSCELDTVRAHLRRNQGEPGRSRNYLSYMSLFVPWPEEASKPLII